VIDGQGEVETISAGSYASARRGGGSGGTVAVVNAFGTIVPGRSSRDSNPVFGGMNVGSTSLADRLEDLREDDAVDAIVIRINSPGGSAAASDVIWHAIKRTAAEKPVIASLGDIAASGGYYIAAATDTIVAQKTTLTGSIGVFSLLLDISGLMEDKLGLTHDAVKTAPHADMFSGLRALTTREREILQQDVDRTYERFKGLVSDGRSLPLPAVEAAAEGRIWAGSDALQLGLVDEIGGLRKATTIAAAKAGLGPDEFRIRTYPRHRGLFEQVSEWIETSSRAAFVTFAGRGSGDWYLRNAAMLSTISELHGQPQALLPMSVTVE
jgi:protease-4